MSGKTIEAGTDSRGSAEKKGVLRSAFARKEAPLFAVYAALTAIMTWPAITLTPRVHAIAGDPSWAVYKLWWYRYSFFNHMSALRVPLVQAPFGLALGNGFSIDPLTELSWRGLSIITNEAVTYNIWILLAFFFNAVAMYYLVRYLTSNRAAAFFSGLAFAFCPYLLWQGEVHVGLVPVMLIPVFLLLLIRAWKLKTTWSIGLCALSFILLTLFSFQNAMLAGAFVVPFAFVMWLAGKPFAKGKRINWKLFLKVASIGVVVLIALAAAFLLFKGTPRAKIRAENAVYVSSLSARPFDYLFPYMGRWGGVLGRLLGNRLEFAHRGAVAETVVFLGYVPLALAAFGTVVTLRRRRKPRTGESEDTGVGDPGGEPGREPGVVSENSTDFGRADDFTRRVVWALLAAGVVAFMLSMPSVVKVGGHRIRTPSYLLELVLPNFRAYGRFGLMVMFSVAVLAGFGVAALLARLKLRGLGSVLLTGALCVLVILEFTVAPPFSSLDTSAASDYTLWLAGQPGDPITAIYPLARYDAFNNCEYLFQLRLHHKKLVNGAGKFPDEPEKYRQVLMDLWHPITPGILASLGVKYVVILPEAYRRPDRINYMFPLDVDTSKLPAGLELVERLPDSEIYEVTAEPAEFIPLFDADISPYVDKAGNVWHGGLESLTGEITSKLETPQTCDIGFSVSGMRTGRVYNIILNGKKVAEVDLETRPTHVDIRGVILEPGKNTFAVETTDPPQSPGDWVLANSIIVVKK